MYIYFIIIYQSILSVNIICVLIKFLSHHIFKHIIYYKLSCEVIEKMKVFLGGTCNDSTAGAESTISLTNNTLIKNEIEFQFTLAQKEENNI